MNESRIIMKPLTLASSFVLLSTSGLVQAQSPTTPPVTPPVKPATTPSAPAKQNAQPNAKKTIFLTKKDFVQTPEKTAQEEKPAVTANSEKTVQPEEKKENFIFPKSGPESNDSNPSKPKEPQIVFKNLLRAPVGLFIYLNDHSQENQYSRMIAYGQWDELNKKLFKTLDAKTAKKIYQVMLPTLVATNEKINAGDRLLTLEDVIALSEISPAPLEESDLGNLGKLAKQSLEAGYSRELFIKKLQAGTKHFGLATYQKKRNLHRIKQM